MSSQSRLNKLERRLDDLTPPVPAKVIVCVDDAAIEAANKEADANPGVPYYLIVEMDCRKSPEKTKGE